MTLQATAASSARTAPPRLPFAAAAPRRPDPAQARAPAPGSAQLWRLFATDAQEAGDAARALQCWREVALREADALDAMFHIACCHALLQEPDRACLIFDALAHAPAAPQALRRRCGRLLNLLDTAAT